MTLMVLEGQLTLHGNYGREGGALLLMSTNVWHIINTAITTTTVDITANIAVRGSAMFLYVVLPSTGPTGFITIEDNLATEGTTIYWIKDSTMNELPFNMSEIIIAEFVTSNRLVLNPSFSIRPKYIL